MKIYYIFFGVFVPVLVVNCHHEPPQFMEPIKNMTIAEGSNVEFSCLVQNLGGFRIMWLKKDFVDDKESLLAINTLKVTKNPRISISMLQVSDELTQSTVYLKGIELEDRGDYVCTLNTNPLTSRTGTLDIPVVVTKGVSDWRRNESLSVEQLSGGNSDVTESHDDEANSSSGCSQIKSVWDEATDGIREMLKSAFTSLVDFCSFLSHP